MKRKEESFDDIVFENRNKDYGAYELRSKYSRRGTIALIISLAFFGIAVGGPLYSAYKKQGESERYVPVPYGPNQMENVEEEKPVVPPPPPPPPLDIKEIKFNTPVIVDSLINDEIEFATADELADAITGGKVDTTSIFVPEQNLVLVKDEDNTIYETFAIHEKPLFEGGDAGIIKYVAEHTNYPIPAQEEGIEGTVYIRFVVTKSGEVGEAKVMRAVDPLLEEEALRVIKSMPKWIPGKNNGNPVNVWFIIPVKFVLK